MTKEADCFCETCDKWFHHQGIMSHRAAHRRRNEDCIIEYSDGRVGRHMFSQRRRMIVQDEVAPLLSPAIQEHLGMKSDG